MELTLLGRSLKLYQILLTRRNSFKKLQNTLDRAKQFEAIRILGTVSHQMNKQQLESIRSINVTEKIIENIYKGEMENLFQENQPNSKESIQICHEVACDKIKSLCLETELDKLYKSDFTAKYLDSFLTHDWHSLNKFLGSVPDNIPTIGIDFGTKNCAVGVLIENQVQMIQFETKPSFPSCVSIKDVDNILIGKKAKMILVGSVEDTIYNCKRWIGRENQSKMLETNFIFPFTICPREGKPVLSVQGNNYYPQDIIAMILRHCKLEVEKVMGVPVSNAVISVPACFNNDQRKATVAAGKKAGFDVINFLNDSLAAAIAYKHKSVISKQASKILVFDVGGGSFDTAVIGFQDKDIWVYSVGGDSFLGGEDIDTLLANFCLQSFEIELTGLNTTKCDPKNFILLKEKCERAKIKLSSMSLNEATSVNISNFENRGDLFCRIRRSQFDELISTFVDRMLRIVLETLNQANISAKEIDEVLLIGGTTNIPKIRNELEKIFIGKPMRCDISTSNAVAYGATIKAAILSCESRKKKFNLNFIQDGIPKAIGIEHNRCSFRTLFPSNNRYPCERSFCFYTNFPFEDSEIVKLYEGDHSIKQYNTLLGVFELKGFDKKKRSRESVKVKIEINNLRILHVKASLSNGLPLWVENITKESIKRKH